MVDMKSTASQELLDERGHDLISKIGVGLTLDTRGGGIIPTKGQRSSLDVDFAPGALGSEKEFYGVHLKSGWYFKGLGEGHTIELLSQAATIDSLTGGQTVPYLYRHALVVHGTCGAMISARWARGAQPEITLAVIP